MEAVASTFNDLEAVVEANSSSTQWSGTLDWNNDEDDGCTSQLSQPSGWQSKFTPQHLQTDACTKAQRVDRRPATPSAAANAKGLHIDVSSDEVLKDDSCRSCDTFLNHGELSAAWPAAFPPAAQRQRQTPDITGCCTPSPCLTSPRDIFGETDDSGNSKVSQRQKMQQWLNQRESQLLGQGSRYGPAAAITQALPPPAFVLMGLLN